MESLKNIELGGLSRMENSNSEQGIGGEPESDFRTQVDEFGRRINDAAVRAKVFAGEKFTQAQEKFNEIKNKDPREVVENAKEYTRQNPTQALLITAAVGIVLGMLLRGRRRIF